MSGACRRRASPSWPASTCAPWRLLENDGNAAKVRTIERLATALDTDVEPLLALRRTVLKNKGRRWRRTNGGTA